MEPRNGGKPCPPAEIIEETRPVPMVLDFLEVSEADLRSDPHGVSGSGSLARVSVSSESFSLGMALEEAEVAGCGFPENVLTRLQLLVGGGLLRGELRLDVDAERLEVGLKSDQGDVVVRSDEPGAVTLRAEGAYAVRGEVTGADLELRLDQGAFGCEGIMDFAFRLTNVLP